MHAWWSCNQKKSAPFLLNQLQYLCENLHIYLHTRENLHTHPHTSTHTCTHAHARTHTHTHTHAEANLYWRQDEKEREEKKEEIMRVLRTKLQTTKCIVYGVVKNLFWNQKEFCKIMLSMRVQTSVKRHYHYAITVFSSYLSLQKSRCKY